MIVGLVRFGKPNSDYSFRCILGIFHDLSKETRSSRQEVTTHRDANHRGNRYSNRRRSSSLTGTQDGRCRGESIHTANRLSRRNKDRRLDRNSRRGRCDGRCRLDRYSADLRQSIRSRARRNCPPSGRLSTILRKACFEHRLSSQGTPCQREQA